MVSEGKEVNVIFPRTIDDVIEKTRNDPLAEFVVGIAWLSDSDSSPDLSLRAF